MLPLVPAPAALLVADRCVHLLVMQTLFKRLPARLVVARDAPTALQLAASLQPRLLLLDLQLADGCALALLRRLRQLAGCREAAAVAITAEGGRDHEGEGFAETWTKPVDLRRTLMRLQALLGLHGAGAAP